MARSLYTNNAAATLASGITNVATTIVLTGGQGAQFPSPTAGNWFYGTLIDAATGLTIEIVQCTARTTDTLTVVRAQQGTSASSYLAGDKFELRVTASGFSELAPLDSPIFTGVLTANGWAPGYQTIATAGTTTTFTLSTPYSTFFTGTNTQTVVMPNATTLTAGRLFFIDNNSTGLITINANGGGLLLTLPSGTDVIMICSSISTSAGIWDTDYSGAAVAGGKVFTVSNTMTLAGTDGTTMTFPSTTGTVATLAANQALTNKTYNGNTWTAGTGVLTIGAGKTLTVNNSVGLTGTDGTTMTFPTTSATIARTDAANTFTGVQTMTSPNFTTPVLGTPTSGNLANCTFPTLNQNTSGTAAGLSATLVAGSGGTGVAGTLTGVLYGNGASAHTVASAAQIVAGIGATAVTNATNATNATTASTQARHNNSTSIATTAYVDNLVPVAYVNYAGSASPSVRNSFNVTSVTRTAAGDYTINLTNSLGVANYVVNANVQRNASTAAYNCQAMLGPASTTTTYQTATTFRVYCPDPTNTLQEAFTVCATAYAIS